MKKKLTFMISMIFMACFLTSCKDPVREIVATSGDGIKYITPTPTVPPESEGIYTSLSECENVEVKLLITNYYSALANKDTDSLKACLSEPSLYSESNYSTLADATKIRVKKIYLIDGVAPLDYVAYVYNEVYIDGVETPVPSLEELFITSVNGSYYVESGTVSADTYNSVVEIINANDGVDQLINSVNLLFNEAISSDADLKAYADAHKEA